MFIAISTLVILIVFIGLLYRHNKKIHIPLMSAAFAIDLTLVLIIELQRKAIENVLVNHSLFVWFHVIISVLVLVFYTILANTGAKMAKVIRIDGETKLVKIHKFSAMIFVILRLTNYVTSFSMPVEIHF